ncbi:MAG: hypothetical protein HeimC2_43060 [Candidatus Heimdallarchaeota archaeon LC_2]|nr:MAG: hypothetical protein HeimC2_43060 [Candidatus Heimdallarchaeota archaeon LC_2]
MAIFTTIFEFYFIGLFVAFLFFYMKNDRYSELINLISAAIFGITLEFLIIIRYENYRYSTDFLVQIGDEPGNVPIVIGLCWGMIIMSSMSISDRTGIKKSIRPLLDTLQAITIDLSMDVIAIRIEGGFWVWGSPLKNNITPDGYFGVIWGNFIAWYLVVLVYSYFLRLSSMFWQNTVNFKMLLFNLTLPIFAYIPFYLILESIRRSYYYQWLITGWIIPYYFAYVFLAMILLALTLIFYEIRQRQVNLLKQGDLLPVILFASFHLFFLFMLIWLEIVVKIPLAAFVTILVVTLDFGLHYILYRYGQIYN